MEKTELELAVEEIVEERGEDAESFVNDVINHGCVSGCVPELIYYTQTHEWFDKYYDDIQNLKEEYEEESGEPLIIEGDLKNTLAWWSFEVTLQKLYGGGF